MAGRGPALPIEAILPDILAIMAHQSNAVLIAPPGAGKTTFVAPALIDQPWCTGKIMLLSPRRLAARAAAERVAADLQARYATAPARLVEQTQVLLAAPKATPMNHQGTKETKALAEVIFQLASQRDSLREDVAAQIAQASQPNAPNVSGLW